MIRDLIKLANDLDQRGMVKEADLIDSILNKYSTDLPGGGKQYQNAPGNLVAPTHPLILPAKSNVYTDPETGEETPVWSGDHEGIREDELLPDEALRMEQKDSAAELSKALDERHAELMGVAARLKEEASPDLDQRLLNLAIRFIDSSMKEIIGGSLPPKHKITLYGQVLSKADQIYEDVSALMGQEDFLGVL